MWAAISLGDISGIGPEVTLKALAALRPTDDIQFLLLGNETHLRELCGSLNLGLEIQRYENPSQRGRIFIFDPLAEPLPEKLEPGSPWAARAAMACLKDGAERCLRQEAAVLVTAPVNKESIIRAGFPFIGQTEFLSQLSGTTRSAMMLLGHDRDGRWLRVALATTHLPLKIVAESLSEEKVGLAIELAAKACADLCLPRARIGVCGLNPHAGEGGEMGTEEMTVIRPVVERFQGRGLDVQGPYSADTLFYHAYAGDYDVVVAMYHDQGLVPLKMVAFETGVNWTLGLPFIRTSPDHGTAYGLAGQGRANPSSMLAAITLAVRLASAS